MSFHRTAFNRDLWSLLFCALSLLTTSLVLQGTAQNVSIASAPSLLPTTQLAANANESSITTTTLPSTTSSQVDLALTEIDLISESATEKNQTEQESTEQAIEVSTIGSSLSAETLPTLLGEVNDTDAPILVSTISTLAQKVSLSDVTTIQAVTTLEPRNDSSNTTEVSTDVASTTANQTEPSSEKKNSIQLDYSNIIISEPNNTFTTATAVSASAKNKTLLSGSYPADFMPEYIRNNGGIIVHIFLLIYACLALGIVCDFYFLSSLEVISNALKLPSDVAGATFMAIGTSAPELFTSMIGVFISQDDIGTGTILGSAVFNLIFIPAVCAFAVHMFCNEPAKVSKFAILRDSIFYLITVTTLLLSLKDNEIDWIESLSMLCLFGIYLVIMYYNAQMSELVSGDNSDSQNETTPLLSQTKNPVTKGDELDRMEKDYRPRSSSDRPRLSSMNEDGSLDEEENWAESNVFLKVLMFPAILAFKLTLPKPSRYCFIMTFIISIFWISGLTYLSVWMVTIIGDTFGIPETVGGLTLLAAGTSIPELISSVLVVKRAGLADMALCNSIGSNIFDILIGLGLPWFLKSVISMFDLGTLSLELTMVPIQSMGLPLTTFTLLLTVVALITTLSTFHWKLGLGVGVTCSIIYIAFIAIASVFEILLN